MLLLFFFYMYIQFIIFQILLKLINRDQRITKVLFAKTSFVVLHYFSLWLIDLFNIKERKQFKKM